MESEKKALVYQKVDTLCVIVSFFRYVERLDEETWFRENQTKSGICHVKKSRGRNGGQRPKLVPVRFPGFDPEMKFSPERRETDFVVRFHFKTLPYHCSFVKLST